MSEFTRSTAQLFFQNSLAEVVRKLRSYTGKRNEEAIEQFIADTRVEVKSTVQSVKVAAVQKAVYFHMLGYDASFASFPVIEVMASTLFSNKRVGYLAACTLFSTETEIIPLMTALLKRDLGSSNQYEAGLALYCISTVCTPELAKDLVSDVVNLLSHPRTYVRKKAVLSLYKIFVQHPESLRPTYPKLKEKLEDDSERSDTDPAVRGAVVCVLCELARRNPANYLGLAIPFYSMLSTVHSNWTLIKIVKVFGYFAPSEPRLGKKLVEPLTNLIRTTGAKSVQYECISAVANGMSKVTSLTKLAVEKIQTFIENPDQNLKFLGLDAMARLVADNPKLMQGQRETVLQCLEDADCTIRCKALVILRDLATKKNVESTINHILERVERTPPDAGWCDAVVAAIVEMVQTDDYALIQDFEWYLGVLLELCVLDVPTFKHGGLIESEVVTILLRVNACRQYGVASLSRLIDDSRVLRSDCQCSTQWMILRAAAFACGEYPYWLEDPVTVCAALLSSRVAMLPADLQVCFLTAACKICAYARQPCERHIELCNGEEVLPPLPRVATFASIVECITPTAAPSLLEAFLASVYTEVQECAGLLRLLLQESRADVGPLLYADDLPPVAYGAQASVQIPEGLDLEMPFCDNIAGLMTLTDSELEADEEDVENDFDLEYRIEQQRLREMARREEVSPFYLRDEGVALLTEEGAQPLKGGISKKAEDNRRSDHCRRAAGKSHAMNRELLKPSNYLSSNMGRRRGKTPEEDEATRRLRHIDLTRALTAEEQLPKTMTYALLQANAMASRNPAAAEAATTADVPPVVLLSKKSLRVTFSFTDCKVNREGTRLRGTLEVENRSVSTGLRDVGVALEPAEPYPEEVVVMEADGAETAETPESTKGLALCTELKPSSVHRQWIVFHWRRLPTTLRAPLPMLLSFSKQKKMRSFALNLPLHYVCFSRRNPTITSDTFNEVLSTTLSGAPVVSAFIPCTRQALCAAVPLIQQCTSLTPVDVFKDAITLYGALRGRKSTLALTHVGVLLREAEESGGRCVKVCVLSRQQVFAELIIHDIAEAVEKAVSQCKK